MRGAGRGLSGLYSEVKLGYSALLKRIAIQPLAGLGVLAFSPYAIDVKAYLVPISNSPLNDQLRVREPRSAILANLNSDYRIVLNTSSHSSTSRLYLHSGRRRFSTDRDSAIEGMR